MFNPNASFSHVKVGLPTEGARPRTRVAPSEIVTRLKRAGAAHGIEVTGEHAAVLAAVFCDLDNVFLTGSAGTGKTTFVRDILIPEINYRGVNFSITASTGIAGSHLSGRTIHSWAGIGPGPEWPEGVSLLSLSPERVQRIYDLTYKAWLNNPRMKGPMREGVLMRIRGCELLIIDEMSMVPGTGLLGYLDFFFKKVRDNDKPFGGIQIFCLGDMLQLPPVEKIERTPGQNPFPPDWCFLSQAWAEGRFRRMKLTKVFRQSDPEFIDLLDTLRAGKQPSPEQEVYIRRFVRPPTFEQALKLTYIVSTNKEADGHNSLVLQHTPGPPVDLDAEFIIRDDQLKHWETRAEVARKLIGSKKLRTRLTLKKDAPVLITVNDPQGHYVNGTKAFVDAFNVIKVHDKDRVDSVTVRLPGAGPEEEWERVTFERKVFSRSPSEDPADMLPADELDHEMALALGRPVPSERHRHPVVYQFPLINAAAITAHSSQGMSLDECVVNVERAFAPGQVYVAVSRLRSPAGLILTSDMLPVFAEPYAAHFDASIVPESLDLGAPLSEEEVAEIRAAAMARAVKVEEAEKTQHGRDSSRMRTAARNTAAWSATRSSTPRQWHAQAAGLPVSRGAVEELTLHFEKHATRRRTSGVG